jgi:hypothetical protein
MTPRFDPASVAEVAEAPASLEQFEPDNAGTCDGTGQPAPAELVDADDDLRWVLWADTVHESAWLGSELDDSWLAMIPPL